MWPQLIARLSPWALRAMGAGRLAGSLGPKSQMIAPPDVADLPTAPFSQSNLAKDFYGISDFLQQKAAAADQGGVDESGFASAYPNPPTQPMAPLQTVNIPSIPAVPASMQNVPLPPPRPSGLDAYGMAPETSGPSLIQKFMQQLHATGPGPYAPDRHAANQGW